MGRIPLFSQYIIGELEVYVTQIFVNQLMPSVLVYLKSLDWWISNRKDVWLPSIRKVFFFFFFFCLILYTEDVNLQMFVMI